MIEAEDIRKLLILARRKSQSFTLSSELFQNKSDSASKVLQSTSSDKNTSKVMQNALISKKVDDLISSQCSSKQLIHQILRNELKQVYSNIQ